MSRKIDAKRRAVQYRATAVDLNIRGSGLATRCFSQYLDRLIKFLIRSFPCCETGAKNLHRRLQFQRLIGTNLCDAMRCDTMNSEAENKSNLACKCVTVKTSLCRLLPSIRYGHPIAIDSQYRI